MWTLCLLCIFGGMSTTTPPGFAQFDASILRRRRGELFDTTEYKHQNAVVTNRGRVVMEALTNHDYERYCEAAGLDPRDMPRVETPHRSDHHGTLPRIDWDQITDERFELDATFVSNELREIQKRVSLAGTHVRVIRHGHSAGVLVPPEWANAQRDALGESSDGEEVPAP